jgi:hypothetical protein
MEEQINFVAMTQNSLLESTFDPRTESWKVTQTITQRRKIDAESEWEQREVTMTAISKNIDIAMARVFLSIEGYLITREHDLFNKDETQPVQVTDGTVVH